MQLLILHLILFSVTDEGSPQSQKTSAQPEENPRSSKITLQAAEAAQNQNSNANSPQAARQSLNTNGKLGGARITGSADRSNRLQTSNYATVIFTPVQVHLNGSVLPSEPPQSDRCASVIQSASACSSPCTTSPSSPHGSMDLHSTPQRSTSATDLAGQRLTPDKDGSPDAKPPSPVPDGYRTPTFPLASYYYPLLNIPHVPYSGYTAVTIPAIQPPLPEKKRLSATSGAVNGHSSVLRVSSAPSPTHHVTFSPSVGEQKRGSTPQHSSKEETDTRVNAKFVQDSSKYWYKPGITRDQGQIAKLPFWNWEFF